MHRLRQLPSAAALLCGALALVGAPAASPGASTDADQRGIPTIVMDVRDAWVFCPEDDPCAMPGGPRLLLPGTEQWSSVYVHVRNYVSVAAIQWAFDWPPTLAVGGGMWLCPPGSIGIPEQPPYGPGPLAGSCASIFDCVTGGASMLIGWVGVRGGSGCLDIIESGYPDGTHIVTCSGEIVPVTPPNRGRVCVGEGGVNTCESVVAVTPVTWGAIKSTYR